MLLYQSERMRDELAQPSPFNFAYMGPINPMLYVHSPHLLEIGQPI